MSGRIDAPAGVESLERWERVPGEHFALRIGETVEDMASAAELVRSAGLPAKVDASQPARPVIEMSPLQRTKSWLSPGDVIVFRRRAAPELGAWSVVTYSPEWFGRRYRRIDAPEGGRSDG